MEERGMKNLCNKERSVDKPYEIWTNNPYSKPGIPTWTWRVLKKWSTDDDKQFSRWFCAVKSPMTYESYEMGDTYVSEIKDVAVKVYDELRPEENLDGVHLTWIKEKWNVK